MDEKLHAEPIMDIAAPPKAAAHAENIPELSPESKPAINHQTSKQPRQNRGVGAAIFATVIIVISLSLLATYAYIKTK
jgi:hypothetical protein